MLPLTATASSKPTKARQETLSLCGRLWLAGLVAPLALAIPLGSQAGADEEAAFTQTPAGQEELLASSMDLADGQPSDVLIDDFISDGRTATAVRWWGGLFRASVDPCDVINGGFEAGDFSGWVALDNGVPGNMAWTVGPAGTCDSWSIHCNSPLEGTMDAMNGFDGQAGLVYELYQDVALPAGALITMVTRHRIQYDSYGAPSTLPRELDITMRSQSDEILSLLYHEDVWLDGAPYTDLGWNEQVFDLAGFGGQTVRLHFNMYIPETMTGPAMIEFDDIALSCTAPAAMQYGTSPSQPNGWLLGFHVPRDDAATLETPLGTYFCDTLAVESSPAALSSCDELDVTEYRVQIADCCLMAAILDPRNGAQPAQADGFHASPCEHYELSVAAVVGRRYVWDDTVCSHVGRWDEYEGMYADVWADETYAYVPNWATADGLPARIHVLDISQPEDPLHVTTFFVEAPNDGASPEDVKAANSLLFVALDGDGNDGAAILDIRAPAAPSVLATVRIPGFEDVHNLFYDAGFLYLADHRTPRVAVVDLTLFDPDAPPASPITDARWIIEGVGSSAVGDMTVKDGRLYAAAGASGVWLYDVTGVGEEAPVLLGYSGGREALSVWPTDDGAFVAVSEGPPDAGVRIYELVEEGDSVIFIVRDELTLPGQAFGPRNVIVVGHRLYASWNQAGLRVLDIDPQDGRLTPVGLYDTSVLLDTGAVEGNWGVYPFLGDDRVLLTDTATGFFVVDVANLPGGCVAMPSDRGEQDAFWGWRTTAAESGGRTGAAGMGMLDDRGRPLCQDWAPVEPGCGSPNLAFELLTTESGGVVCGCLVHDDCNDADACTLDECVGSSCVHTPRLYGDADGSDVVNVFDLLRILDGIAGDFSQCAFVNLDLEPCAGNGIINIFDLLAVLDAIAGEDPCGCTPPEL